MVDSIIEIYRKHVKQGQEAVVQARRRYEKNKTRYTFSADRSELDRFENMLTQDMARLAVAEQIRKDTLDELRKTGHHVDKNASYSSLGERSTLSNQDNTGTYVFIPDDEVK
jgi:exonuclease VII large subunit